jgi:hypothetical protein
MGGYSAKCAYCGKWYLRPAQLYNHKRGAHNIGNHKGGLPDQQDMSEPWAGKLLPGVEFYGPPEPYGPPYPSYVVWEARVDKVDQEGQLAHMTMVPVEPPTALAVGGTLWAVFPLSYYPAPPEPGMLYRVRAKMNGSEQITVTPMPAPPLDEAKVELLTAHYLRMAKELRGDGE